MSRNFTLKALILFAIIALFLASGTFPAHADTPDGNAGVVSGAGFWFFKPEVIVANTEAEPVPVKTVDSDVTVVNSSSDPVPVQDVDKLERTPFHVDNEDHINDGSDGGGWWGIPVPPGKRAVIEYASIQISLPNTSSLQVPVVAIGTWLPENSPAPFGGEVWHKIPLMKIGSTDTHDIYTGGLSTKLYCEDSDGDFSADIKFTVARIGGTEGEAPYEMSYSGYLIDLTP